MLDENLPTFYLKASKDKVGHDASLHLSQYGSEPAPAYTLRHPDPASHDAKNRYAAALCDSYNSDILYGEVLLIPEWNQPTLSQEDIRKNGGVTPAPQPIMPNEFVVQLYNPDQQITIRHKPSTWKDAQSWEFEMPIQTFRQPSASNLDRTQSDPTALEHTPTIDLKWKRDGKLSKDLLCYLNGRSKNPDGSKKKHKEPDIPLAFFRNMREMTVYEPNLQRIDVEDAKGFEVVLLLGAIVIKDVFFGQMREAFNISDGPRSPTLVGGQRRPTTQAPTQQQPQQHPSRYHNRLAHSGPATIPSQPSPRPVLSVQTSSSRPPPTDPRSQWEIDQETARLKQQTEQEAKERKKQAERERKEREKREKEDEKRARQIAEEEERAARKRQANVDKETERLRQEYFAEQRRMAGRHPNLPPRHSAPNVQQQQFRPAQPSPYLQVHGPSVGGSSGMLAPQNQVKQKRSSFFGRNNKAEGQQRLLKKQSAIF